MDKRTALGWSAAVAAGLTTDSLADWMLGSPADPDDFEDDDGSYPPPCPGRKDHSWVTADEDNGGDGRCYCEYCGADGDA